MTRDLPEVEDAMSTIIGKLATPPGCARYWQVFEEAEVAAFLWLQANPDDEGGALAAAVKAVQDFRR